MKALMNLRISRSERTCEPRKCRHEFIEAKVNGVKVYKCKWCPHYFRKSSIPQTVTYVV